MASDLNFDTDTTKRETGKQKKRYSVEAIIAYSFFNPFSYSGIKDMNPDFEIG